MMRKTISIALVLAMLSTALVGCNKNNAVIGEPNFAGAYSEMNDPSFWISQQKTPDKVLMTSSEITAFTKNIASTEGTKCVDLASFPDTLTRDELLKAIQTNDKPDEPRYIGDKLITDEQYARYFENRNEQAVQESNPVKWGVIVNNSELRTFPTLDVSYNEVDEIDFDFGCETVLKTNECVAILATSADNSWFLVQAFNYMGWVEQKNIAVTDKSSWLALVNMPDILVVTGNRVLLDHNNINPATSRRELTMGTRLPFVVDKPDFVDGISTLSSYVAQIPVRTASGTLLMSEVRIPMNLDVSVGYIPYTTRNITLQAFKLLGERYGWSSLWSARDCSSTLSDIFQCFGIDLPRNTSAQKAVDGINTDISQLTTQQRTSEILKQPVGTLFFIPGHIVMYLGNYQGKPYVFHQTSAIIPENGENPVKVSSALVSTLSIKRASGKTFTDSITNLIVLQGTKK